MESMKQGVVILYLNFYALNIAQKRKTSIIIIDNFMLQNIPSTKINFQSKEKERETEREREKHTMRHLDYL